MKQTYLLIVTDNNRKFLTKRENMDSLLEFVKTFKAEIYLAQAENAKVLEIVELVRALCDQEYDDNPECDKMDRLYPAPPKKNRQSILRQSSHIDQYIETRLLAKESISLKKLKKHFKKYNVTDACLCNHLASVRDSLIKAGHSVEKTGRGEYAISQS